jgi:hypothetical protein
MNCAWRAALFAFVCGFLAWQAASGVLDAAVSKDAAKVISAPLALPKRAIAPSKDLGGESVPLSDSLSNGFTLFLPQGWQAPHTGDISLTVHFHTVPWFAIQEHLRYGLNTPLLVVNLGEGSSVYRKPFEDPNRFSEWLDLVTVALREHGAPTNAGISSVAIASFSAGYGAVRELVKSPRYFQLIGRIVLCDSMYGSLQEDGTTNRVPASEYVAPWVPFAQAAARGEKTFVLTHSQVPTEYASSAEMATALIRAVGAPIQKVSQTAANEDPDYRLQYRSDLGNFHVWGYSGMDASAHLTHVRHLAEVWRALDGR